MGDSMLRACAALLALASVGPRSSVVRPVAGVQGEATRNAIQVRVRLAPPAAVEQATVAFVRESLMVAQANVYAGTVTSMPVQRGTGAVRLALTYHATISPVGDSEAIIVLTGTYRFRDPAGTMAVDERPITSMPLAHTMLARVEAWAPIERMATWLKLEYGDARANH